MPEFCYRALSTDGQVCEGHVMADNQATAHKILVARSLIPVQISTNPFRVLFRSKSSLSETQLKYWCQQLAALLETGIALDTALDELAKEPPTSHPMLTFI